jgi:hypothetical protein
MFTQQSSAYQAFETEPLTSQKQQKAVKKPWTKYACLLILACFVIRNSTKVQRRFHNAHVANAKPTKTTFKILIQEQREADNEQVNTVKIEDPEDWVVMMQFSEEQGEELKFNQQTGTFDVTVEKPKGTEIQPAVCVTQIEGDEQSKSAAPAKKESDVEEVPENQEPKEEKPKNEAETYKATTNCIRQQAFTWTAKDHTENIDFILEPYKNKGFFDDMDLMGIFDMDSWGEVLQGVQDFFEQIGNSLGGLLNGILGDDGMDSNAQGPITVEE